MEADACGRDWQGPQESQGGAVSEAGDAMLLQANARRIPLASGSVHCCACSPPYFGLRSYLDQDDPNKAMEIGQEPTPAEFVEAMLVVAKEVHRVLRSDGCWWMNLGDSFNSSPSNQNGISQSSTCKSPQQGSSYQQRRKREVPGLKPKDLCMVPERVALALQEDGWYIRSKPPWVKNNCMPESTCDRPNVAHESIFLLTKQARYFFDMEAVRVPCAATTLNRDQYSRVVREGNKSYIADTGILSRPTLGLGGEHRGIKYSVQHDHETPSHAGGRHLRTNDFFTESLDALIEHHESYLAHLRKIRDDGGLLLSEGGDPLAFWVATQSFNGAHFATWPERLVRIMIKASTSEVGNCAECSAPYVRVITKESFTPIDYEGKNLASDPQFSQRRILANVRARRQAGHPHSNPFPTPNTVGWQPSCSCRSSLAPVPATVLDCFNGAGTTGVVALALGRRYIGLELKRSDLTMSQARIADSLRPVSRYDPPRPVKPLDGQMELFGE
jgi:DNA modification methylase